MRVAHILHNKVHWIFNPNVVFGINEMPNLPPDAEGNPIILIDITDRPEIVEGWNYNKETGEVSEPISEDILPTKEIQPSIQQQPEIPQNEFNQLLMQQVIDLQIKIDMLGV